MFRNLICKFLGVKIRIIFIIIRRKHAMKFVKKWKTKCISIYILLHSFAKIAIHFLKSGFYRIAFFIYITVIRQLPFSFSNSRLHFMTITLEVLPNYAHSMVIKFIIYSEDILCHN